MKILLALDDCQRAQKEAIRLARSSQATVTAFFVLDSRWNVFVGHDWLSGSNSRADFLDWMREEEHKAAEAAFGSLRSLADGIRVEEKIVAGNVQEEILKEAHRGYDLLIMANPFFRGLEAVRKAAPDIAESCPCDLLLVQRPAI